MIKRFKPCIIISDFEGTSAIIGNLLDIPVICACNGHSVTKLKYNVPRKYLRTYMKAQLVVRTIYPKVDYHLITTFFYLPVRSKNVYLFPPILRKEIYRLKPKRKDYILVYQTSSTNLRLIKLLKKIKCKFIIYGFDINKKEGNLVFREFNTEQFLKDLQDCNACSKWRL
jgi:uncharacterized protein (TIGR00661 family)